MTPNMPSLIPTDLVPPPRSAKSRELKHATAGAAIGSAVGIFAGPIGIVTGAFVGAAVGALAERTVEKARLWADRNDAALDATIGISGGDMGCGPFAGLC